MLYFAKQFGKYISKLSLVESEYFLACKVTGQIDLKIIKVIPSKSIKQIQIQTHLSILFTITA